MASGNVSLDSVMAALRTVKDPEYGKDILTANLVKDLKIQGDAVSLKLIVKSASKTVREQMTIQVRDALTRLAGSVQAHIAVESPAAQERISKDKNGIPGIKHIIAVSSGKGGVGKSTVSANLAFALTKLGHSVGLLDTDVYGPNIPTMVGLRDQAPEARMDETRGELIVPLETTIDGRTLKVMSMGFLTKGDQPLVWRGPMLHSMVSQFLLKVEWGNLDYLIVDMPPGTGDIQLSLTQIAPVSGAVIVTTPQEVSLQDVRKAILMFEKVGVPILGIVENMSYFICDGCDKRHYIFGQDGALTLTDKFKVPLLAQLPLNAAVRQGGDQGRPIVVQAPTSQHAKLFLELARAVHNQTVEASLNSGTESGAPVVHISGFDG